MRKEKHMNELQNPFDDETDPQRGGTDPFGEPRRAADPEDARGASPFDDAAPFPEDLGSDENAEDPFGDPAPKADAGVQTVRREEPKEIEEPQAGAATDPRPEQPRAAEESAEPVAEISQIGFAQTSIYAKPPVFEHASVREAIEDTSLTFDELRAAKSDDFPELEDANRVTWEVTYGKTKKFVIGSDAKKKKIGEFKSGIERSKEFETALKTSKDKNPSCVIKPKVTAQSKGRMAAYKGVFANVEAARASGKAICHVPGRDGKVYEIRRNETGEYVTPAGRREDFSEIRAGFTPALPPVPYALLGEIVRFFRSLAREGDGLEAIANVYWDRELREYRMHIPKQRVTRTSAESDLTDAPDPSRYVHFIDAHSHNAGPARFSAKDDKDEKATRVYAVFGRLDEEFPEIGVRIANGGKHFPIDPATVFGDPDDRRPERRKTEPSRVRPRGFADFRETGGRSGAKGVVAA
jgi:PRTRC genetic system protein A